MIVIVPKGCLSKGILRIGMIAIYRSGTNRSTELTPKPFG
jgi:hypothetical protein